MKIAVIGSRNAHIDDLEKYLPTDCTEIVSGGAVGIDRCAADFAKANDIPLKEFLPEYKLYGRAAPIVRNRQIVDYADYVIAFMKGSTPGTLSVIKYCEKLKKPHTVIILP